MANEMTLKSGLGASLGASSGGHSHALRVGKVSDTSSHLSSRSSLSSVETVVHDDPQHFITFQEDQEDQEAAIFAVGGQFDGIAASTARVTWSPLLSDFDHIAQQGTATAVSGPAEAVPEHGHSHRLCSNKRDRSFDDDDRIIQSESSNAQASKRHCDASFQREGIMTEDNTALAFVTKSCADHVGSPALPTKNEDSSGECLDDEESTDPRKSDSGPSSA